MKKNLKLLIIIILLSIIAIIMYQIVFSKKPKKDDFSGVRNYIKDIYGRTFLIPEFSDINEADESWLWENVSQYVWNHDDTYHEQNEQPYGYSYDDISKIVKILYGDSLQKKFPKGAVAMRYYSYNDSYGPTSFGITNYYDYKIDNITKNGNVYTVSLYDYTVSLENFYKNVDAENAFEIFNNYDYMLNGNNATPLLTINTLKDEKFKNILKQKEALSHKILTITYNEAEGLYYIKSCQYENTKDSELLAAMYNKMQNTFEIMSIDYTQEDIYSQDEVIVNNFDELISIYTENAVPTYKEEMSLFIYKDNGEVYITAGDITVRDYISTIEFKDIQTSENQITCSVVRTFRKSFDPTDEDYSETYQKEDNFTIVKIDGKWFVDEFRYTWLDIRS